MNTNQVAGNVDIPRLRAIANFDSYLSRRATTSSQPSINSCMYTTPKIWTNVERIRKQPTRGEGQTCRIVSLSSGSCLELIDTTAKVPKSRIVIESRPAVQSSYCEWSGDFECDRLLSPSGSSLCVCAQQMQEMHRRVLEETQIHSAQMHDLQQELQRVTRVLADIQTYSTGSTIYQSR